MASKEEKFNEVSHYLRLFMITSHRYLMKNSSNYEITPQQAHTLSYIETHPGLIQRELGDFFHLRNASITNMVKNLERDGYIERKNDPKSARIKRIYLTKKGKEKTAKIKKCMADVSRQLASKIDEEDLDNLLISLKHINDDLKD